MNPEMFRKALEGKVPEADIKVLEQLLNKVQEQGVIKWEDLDPREKFALATFLDDKEDITLETFAKILQNSPPTPQEKILGGENAPSFSLSGNEKEDFSVSPIPKGNIGEEGKPKGKIGEEFYYTLLKAIMRSDLTNKPYDALAIAALYLANQPVTREWLDQKVSELHDMLKGPRLKEVLGGKKEEYSPKSLGNAIDSVVNNTYLVKRVEERKIQYFSLLDEVRDKILKALEELWEEEQVKKELEEKRITDKEVQIDAFVNFFRHYVDDKGRHVYMEALEELLAGKGGQRLSVDWAHLAAFNSELAEELLEHPEDVILSAEDAVRIILQEDFLKEQSPVIHVGFYNLPKTYEPRHVGPEYINKLIQVKGVMTRLSSVEPFVSKAIFVCRDCGNKMIRLQKPYSMKFVKPVKCEACGSREIVLDDDESTFLRYQSGIIQDQPERLKGGQYPRQLHVVFLEDLCDRVIPGDRVILTGILRLVEERQEKGPVKRVVLVVNHIEKESKDIEDIKITPEEEQQIREEVKRPDFKERLIRSFAPTVYGNEKEKLGLLLSLFGGEDTISPTGERRRKRIHVLLTGDPGTAKSHLLDFVAQVAPRAVRASGKGVTGVGLTAAATRDELTGKWTVEAGTLVLADQGFAVIDELDKMGKADRDSLHEPMEQGHIDFAKAGINMILNARATVIAAANPKLGRFSKMKPLPEQIDLPPTLWSRFDLIFLFVDEPNETFDQNIAKTIFRRWYRPEEVQPPYSPEFIQKMIAYARRKIKEIKAPHDVEEIVTETYVKLRKSSKRSALDDREPVPITPRQFEAILRLAEAHARMHLRDTITREDVEAAIDLIMYSLRMTAMDEEGNIDVSIIEVGRSSKEIKRMEQVLEIVKMLQDLDEHGAPEDDVIKEARAQLDLSENEVREILEALLRADMIYKPRRGFYKVL